MLPNAFIGEPRKPTQKQLASALGPAKAVWDELLTELSRKLGVNGREWKSYTPKAGWSLRLKRKQRTILWLAPCRGAMRVAFILGDRALEACRAARLPRRVTQAIEKAVRYPEGTAVRLEIKKAVDLPAITKLAEIKTAH
jgi:hypothetical protein